MFLPVNSIYWSFFALNQSNNLSYTFRDLYRNETSVPRDRYIDYATIGYLGTYLMAFVYEWAMRLTENVYGGRNMAQHVLHLNRLGEHYQVDGKAATNFRSLDKVPDLAVRVSGSMSNRQSLDTLAMNKGEALWEAAHKLLKSDIPKDQFPAWLQFNRRFNYFHIGNLNRVRDVLVNGQKVAKPYLSDFIGLALQKDSQCLHRMLQKYQAPKADELMAPGLAQQFTTLAGKEYQQLTRSQANTLRYSLEEHQIILKLLSQLSTDPPKKYILFGPPKASASAPLASDKHTFFKSVDLSNWKTIINGDHAADTAEGKLKKLIVGILDARDFSETPSNGSLKKSIINVLDNLSLPEGPKSKIVGLLNVISASDKASSKGKWLAAHLSPEREALLDRAFTFVKKALNNESLGLKPFARPGDALPDNAVESLFTHLSDNFKHEANDIQTWLKAYLHDGMLAQRSKKMMTSLSKSQFWLTMATSVAVNFVAFGTTLTMLQMKWAIPLQNKLVAQGIDPKKMMQGPMLLAPIPGVLAYAALMHQDINKHIPILGKAFLSLNRLMRHTVAGVLGLSLTTLGVVWGLNRNIKNEQARLKQAHPTWGQKVIPAGMQEVRLNPYGFQHFAQTNPSNSGSQGANPFATVAQP